LHWSTQLDYFITVRAGGTPYGMYKQALRELDKRERGLNSLYAERDRLQIDIEELEARIRSHGNHGLHPSVVEDSIADFCSSTYDKRRWCVDLRQKQFALTVCERSIHDHERERSRFIKQALRLRHVLEIDADHPLSPERRTVLDRDMWVHLLQRDAAMELLTRGTVEKNTLCMIMSLPREARTSILSMIQKQVRHTRETGDIERGPLIEWFLSNEPPRLEDHTTNEDTAQMRVADE
jgi:hypothetical protein